MSKVKYSKSEILMVIGIILTPFASAGMGFLYGMSYAGSEVSVPSDEAAEDDDDAEDCGLVYDHARRCINSESVTK